MPTFTINRKGGYEMVEVDAYINSLEQQLKEYENKASAINKAIISAQMASDKMVKQANEETAAVVKKANEQSAEMLKKANEEYAALIKKANDEAAEILNEAENEKKRLIAEAHKTYDALAENADSQLADIKKAITKQKELIRGFDKDYAALVEKYLKVYTPDTAADMVKNLDEIDELVSEWQKSGVPEPTGAKQQNVAVQTNINPAMAATQHRAVSFGMPLKQQTPASQQTAQETKPADEAPKSEPVPSPLAASSVPKPAEEEPKSEAPKPFVKTGLAGGMGMGGIPANPSYGLGGERTLKNSVSHSEAPKNAEPAPEPVAAAKINVPKFGEAAAAPAEEAKPVQAAAPVQEAPKPGIYKVTADNHLYNENNKPASSEPAANASAQAAPAAESTSQPAPMVKPGIYKVENGAPRPGIYKVTSDNKLYNDNTENK